MRPNKNHIRFKHITVKPALATTEETNMNQPNQTEIDPYDTTNYIKPDHVIPKVLVTEKTDRAVIIGPGGSKTFQKKDPQGNPVGEPEEKLFIEVEFPSGRRYEYRMGRAQTEKLAAKLGPSRRTWVGAVLMFSPESKNTMEWCSAVVIDMPKNNVTNPISSQA